MTELLNEVTQFAGPISRLENAPAIDFDGVRRHLPQGIEELLHDHGLSSFFGGRLLLCNPDDLMPVLREVFASDPDFDPEAIRVYAYSAFGTLLAWHRVHWLLGIDLVRGIVYCSGFFRPELNRNDVTAVFVDLLGYEARDLDFDDVTGKALFSRVRRQYGGLSYGDCYGFVPALALGGSPSVESTQRLRALEHFSILASTQTFVLRDTSQGRMVDVRNIGGG